MALINGTFIGLSGKRIEFFEFPALDVVAGHRGPAVSAFALVGLIGVGAGARSVGFLVRQHLLIPQNQRLRREKAGDNP